MFHIPMAKKWTLDHKSNILMIQGGEIKTIICNHETSLCNCIVSGKAAITCISAQGPFSPLQNPLF